MSENTLYDNIAKMAEVRQQLTDLRKSLGDLERQHQALTQEASKLEKEVIKQLDAQDLIQRGNMGWEVRVVGFLSNLYRQLQERHSAEKGQKAPCKERVSAFVGAQ